MTEPKEVSKEAYALFEGERWNAFVDLIMGADLTELTHVQRIAHLANWYSCEVLNGGHDQYFGNKEYFDHFEVIAALNSIGANCQSAVLKEALTYYMKAIGNMPEGYDEYIAWEQDYGYEARMRKFDEQFYACRPEIEAELLEAYLNTNESEFIKWVL